MGTSGMGKNSLVMVRATKASPSHLNTQGKRTEALSMKCEPLQALQLQNSNSKKKPSAVARGAHRNWTPRSWPRPRAQHSAWSKRTCWVWNQEREVLPLFLLNCIYVVCIWIWQILFVVNRTSAKSNTEHSFTCKNPWETRTAGALLLSSSVTHERLHRIAKHWGF